MSSAAALLGPGAVGANSSRIVLRKELITRAGIITGLLTPKAVTREPLSSEVSSAPRTIWDSVLLWAVPKKRTSHSKKRMRMAHKYLKPKTNYQTCPKCGNLKLCHVLCGHCFRETMKLTAEFRKNMLAEAGGTTTSESGEDALSVPADKLVSSSLTSSSTSSSSLS